MSLHTQHASITVPYIFSCYINLNRLLLFTPFTITPFDPAFLGMSIRPSLYAFVNTAIIATTINSSASVKPFLLRYFIQKPLHNANKYYICFITIFLLTPRFTKTVL